MFDISFSELLIVAVVALIVLGPERLPKVARTVGHLLGRAQRYVNDVKSDIQKEMDLDEVQRLKKEMEQASTTVKDSVSDLGKQFSDPLKEAQESVESLGQQTEAFAKHLESSTDGSTSGSGDTQAHAEGEAKPAAPSGQTAAATADSAKASVEAEHKPTNSTS